LGTPLTETVILWLALSIAIWTLAAADPAPNMSAARKMNRKHLERNILPSR
jgi:hypothetical protein